MSDSTKHINEYPRPKASSLSQSQSIGQLVTAELNTSQVNMFIVVYSINPKSKTNISSIHFNYLY